MSAFVPSQETVEVTTATDVAGAASAVSVVVVAPWLTALRPSPPGPVETVFKGHLTAVATLESSFYCILFIFFLLFERPFQLLRAALPCDIGDGDSRSGALESCDVAGGRQLWWMLVSPFSVKSERPRGVVGCLGDGCGGCGAEDDAHDSGCGSNCGDGGGGVNEDEDEVYPEDADTDNASDGNHDIDGDEYGRDYFGDGDFVTGVRRASVPVVWFRDFHRGKCSSSRRGN